ncbi:MAG: PAS domain S-box protein [Sedimentisphaerales bacterium]
MDIDRDVTGRKEAQENIVQTLSLLTAILESTADGILAVDLSGRVVSCNQKFQQLWRLPNELIESKDDNKLLAFVLDQLADPEAFLAEVRRLYASIEEESFDVLKFKDGRVFERFSQPQKVGDRVVGRVWSFRNVTEYKQAEEALRKSEYKFRTLFTSSRDGIAMADLDGHITECNQAYADMLGYSPEELRKTTFLKLTPGKWHRQNEEMVKYVLVKGYSDEFEKEYLRKDGTILPVSLRTWRIDDNKGHISGICSIVRDITERKRAEERLLAINTLLKFLLPPAPIEQKLKVVTDAVVRILDADFARIWVIKPGDRCEAGCTHAQATEGPHVCRSRDQCLHLMASSGRYTHIDGKGHCRVPFGCYKIGLIAAGEQDKFLTNEAATDPRVHNHAWARELGLVSFAGYRLTHTDGKPLGVLALFSKHPVSPEEDALLERIAYSTSMVIHAYHMEEALRHEKDFAKSLTDTAQVIMLVLDTNARIVNFNPYMEDISGYKLEEVKGKDWFDTFLPKAERSQIKDVFKQAISGIQTKGAANSIITKDGREVLIEWYDKTLKDKDGQTIGLITIGQDITERRRAEEAVENLNKDLKSTVVLLTQSNKQLNEFAYLAAHDLKTPLRGIGTLAQWLVNDYKEKFDDEGRRQVDLLVKRVKRMNELINAILQYSTIARNRHNERPVNLNTLVETILVEVKPPPNIKITINKNLPVVVCDQMLLQQVFYHLLTNAVKFMDKPDGLITIDFTDRNNVWEFSVSDNGPGIAPQHLERIFRLFQTLGDPNQSEGSGVGLTIARKIVELYGGQIWLTSELGQGSTFFFTLPKVLNVTDNQEQLLTISSC